MMGDGDVSGHTIAYESNRIKSNNSNILLYEL